MLVILVIFYGFVVILEWEIDLFLFQKVELVVFMRENCILVKVKDEGNCLDFKDIEEFV